MTLKEALELVEQCGLNTEGNKHAECEEIVISALEKQIPKKPKEMRIDVINDLMISCPCCKKYIVLWNNTHKPPYCQHCGQALDWKNEN